jgi:pimeloyl-ACP methyl ester carboxylesterase
MNPAKTETLQLPGTSLYYKVNGSGPVLLLLLGGAADADGADGLAGLLAQHFTVVSYDRRGLSRSKIADPAALLRLETHGDDASSLLASLTTEPALVFGSSIGAVIGLDLAIRHPERVGTLVAHEPPAPELLPDTERASFVRSQEEVEEVFRRDGMPAA